MVSVPGNPNVVGPVTLDQIKRGIDHGKLDVGAQIAQQGTNNWAGAAQVIQNMTGTHGAPAMVAGMPSPLPSVDMTPPQMRPSYAGPYPAAPPPRAPGAPPPPPSGSGSGPGDVSAMVAARSLAKGRRPPPPPPGPSKKQLPSAPPPRRQAPSRSSAGGPPPPPPKPSGGPPAPPPMPVPTHEAAAVPGAPMSQGAPPPPPAGSQGATPSWLAGPPSQGSQAGPPPLPSGPPSFPGASGPESFSGSFPGAEAPPAEPSAPVPLTQADPATRQDISKPAISSPIEEEAPEDVTAPQRVPQALLDQDVKEAESTCPRCHSDKVVGQAMLGVANGTGLVLRLQDGSHTSVSVGFCGNCGNIVLTAEGAAKLYESLRG